MRRYGEAYSEETREKVRKAEYAMDKLAFVHDEAAQKGFDAIRKILFDSDGNRRTYELVG